MTMRVWRITSLILFLLLLAGPPARAQQAPLAGLDEYVNKAMKDWGVPGVAIAVIKDDRIVLAKGYGVRELGKPEPVDERTLFAIGSSSKAFTLPRSRCSSTTRSSNGTTRRHSIFPASSSTIPTSPAK
jgi:CubicO group peptidase (beta-lactamase class C family)